MALTYKLHWQAFRENKYELVFSVYDGDTTIMGNHRIDAGEKELDKEGIDKCLSAFLSTINTEAAEYQPPLKEAFTRDEVETLLKEKGLLADTEHFEDLKAAAEIMAEKDVIK